GILLLGACAAGPNPDQTPGGYGFWWGLWHGIILPVSFIVSLFTDSVSIYEVDNDGNWYDVGFMLGIALFSGPVMPLRGRPAWPDGTGPGSARRRRADAKPWTSRARRHSLLASGRHRPDARP